MKKLFLQLFVTLTFTVAAMAQTENELLKHTDSWAAVLQKAQQENKPIFVDCYFTGCHPCAQMDAEVFPNEMVGKEMNNNFIAIKVDVFKEKLGDTINMKYCLSGYPTFLILSPSGNLVSMFSGYKDAGLLLNELNMAKTKISNKEYLSGFAVAYSDNYPEFYKQRYSKEHTPIKAADANAWLTKQKDLKAEPAALTIMVTRGLESSTDEFVLNNYAAYRGMYGEMLLLNKTSYILESKMNKLMNRQRNDESFAAFLQEHERLFPAADWNILRHLVANNYYNVIAKDTTAYLRFMNQYPVIYQNYFGAYYNSMIVKKQLNEATLKLLCGWAAKTVTSENAFDLLQTVAAIHKQAGDMNGYKKYITMAVEKAKKYGVNAVRYEKMLASL